MFNFDYLIKELYVTLRIEVSPYCIECKLSLRKETSLKQQGA